jgi:hypothetical protein
MEMYIFNKKSDYELIETEFNDSNYGKDSKLNLFIMNSVFIVFNINSLFLK